MNGREPQKEAAVTGVDLARDWLTDLRRSFPAYGILALPGGWWVAVRAHQPMIKASSAMELHDALTVRER